MKKITLALLLITYSIAACTQPTHDQKKVMGGSCEDCELLFAGMPTNPSGKTSISEKNEAGQPLVISGTVYQADGKTPAEGIILYVYQTDNKGLYSPGQNQPTAGRHGHLRGWMKTDATGYYEFRTIRPASYPGSKIPQHIHAIVYEPSKGYYWIDEYQFIDDPFLTNEEKKKATNRGGSGIISLKKKEDSSWIGKRNIVLGLNIPSYQQY
jgi:protocatechuate 3,4-dioxygenase, beta subunit